MRKNSSIILEQGYDGTNSIAATFLGCGQGQNFFGDMDLHEVIIYDKSLSNTEMSQIETYLNQKWGVF
jgi:hypothetical protein